MRLRLANHSAAVKRIQIFSFVEFCLWDAYDDMTNFQRNFSTGKWRWKAQGFTTRPSTGSAATTTPLEPPSCGV